MQARFRFLRPTVPTPDRWLSRLSRPYVDEWFTNFGPLSTELSQTVAARFPPGSFALPVANATVGLQSALLATNVVGRRVVIPAFTFPATLHAVTAAGGIPHIVDVDSETWQLNGDQIPWRSEGHGSVAAIVLVKTFGAHVDNSDWITVASQRGVPVVIDSAAAFPVATASESKAREAGTLKVFSFHATKPLSIGEGGIIVGPAEAESRVRSTTNFGLGITQDVSDGTNAKMDEFTAARALAALEDFDSNVLKRQDFVRKVYESVDLSAFMLLPSSEQPAWSFFPLLCPSAETANRVAELATLAGVETRRYYAPDLAGGYSGSFPVIAEDCPVSRSLSERMICFPVYADSRTEEEQHLHQIFASIIRATS